MVKNVLKPDPKVQTTKKKLYKKAFIYAFILKNSLGKWECILSLKIVKIVNMLKFGMAWNQG